MMSDPEKGTRLGEDEELTDSGDGRKMDANAPQKAPISVSVTVCPEPIGGGLASAL